MAAAKVFAIPELLEKILIDCYRERKWKYDAPAPELFVLQGVRKTFRDAINSSIKIRRLMHLAPVSAGDACDEHSAMHWLFHEANTTLRKHPPRYELRYDTYRLKANNIIYGSVKKYDYLEASWRQIFIEPSGQAMQIVLRETSIFFNSLSRFRGRMNRSPSLYWHFKANATLGDVWDKFKDLVEQLQVYEEQSKNRHADRVKEDMLIKERRKAEDQKWDQKHNAALHSL